MKKTEDLPTSQKPTDLAREAFRQLAIRKIPPTPQAYTQIYHEIAGISPEPAKEVQQSAPPESPAIDVLTGFAGNLCLIPGEATEYGKRLQRACDSGNWSQCGVLLSQLIERYLKRGTMIELAAAELQDGSQTRLMRDLLARTLTYTVASLLQDVPELAMESEALGAALKTANTDAELGTVANRLKQLCYKIELKTGDLSEKQELLFRLFRLLLDNVSDLLEEESWIHGQIEVVQNLIANPLELRLLEDALRSLKEVIYKQGILKSSLADAKVSVKNMMATFIDRLNDVATSTSHYHDQVGTFARKINGATSVAQLQDVVGEMLHETKLIQSQALSARDQMMAAREEVKKAETRITELEQQIKQMSELVREDQLTGSLNRRGLDDVFEREAARADRRGTGLCVAMLDLDNFKRLNDTLGHIAGDEALIHLVKVVKTSLRSMDVIARFGGEEFVILLPETTLEEAIQTLTRLQRSLTKHFFLHNNERVLITFSAGVALRERNEDQAAVVARADKALYQAKAAGKNRVVASA